MSFKALVNIIIGLANSAVLVILSLLVAIFVVKVIIGIAKSDSGDNRKKLRDTIIYGLLGLFVAISFFAIARLLAGFIGI